MTFRHERRESLGNLGIAPSLKDAADDDDDDAVVAICMPLSDKEQFPCKFE